MRLELANRHARTKFPRRLVVMDFPAMAAAAGHENGERGPIKVHAIGFLDLDALALP